MCRGSQLNHHDWESWFSPVCPSLRQVHLHFHGQPKALLHAPNCLCLSRLTGESIETPASLTNRNPVSLICNASCCEEAGCQAGLIWRLISECKKGVLTIHSSHVQNVSTHMVLLRFVTFCGFSVFSSFFLKICRPSCVFFFFFYRKKTKGSPPLLFDFFGVKWNTRDPTLSNSCSFP